MTKSSVEARIAAGYSRVSSAYGIVSSGTLNMSNNSSITINDPSTYYNNGRFGVKALVI